MLHIESPENPKKNPNTELSPEEKEFNRELSQIRAIAENTFFQIKKFEIISTKYRDYSKSKNNNFDLNQIFRICCFLAQKKILRKPLRDKDWVHPLKRKYFCEMIILLLIFFVS